MAEKPYLVGIKGTGMAALAVLLSHGGEQVRGCDVAERFSTDQQLEDAGIPVDVGFEPDLLPADTTCVVYSSAYKSDLPILEKGRALGVPVLDYNQFLARLTRRQDSYVVCGTHGKTTCTAMTAFLLSQGKRKDYPFYAIYGSMLKGSHTMPDQGREAFLLEGCEYRDHFLSYQTRGALLTTCEWDHPDYFPSEKAYVESFRKFIDQIQSGGFLVICVDGRHMKELADYASERNDLMVVRYGFSDRGMFSITREPELWFSLPALADPFRLPVKSDEWICDMVGSSLFATCMLLDARKPKLYLDDGLLVTDEALVTVLGMMLRDIPGYPGTVGRMEVMADEGGVLYIDDYAHHPTQIKTVIEGLRARYPRRRIVVVFAPHTQSRTMALFDGFVKSLSLADAVIVQPTFASARGDGALGDDSARELASALEKRMERHRFTRLGAVTLVKDDQEAASTAASWLMAGDILVTMGAGNNRFLTGGIIALRNAQ